MQVHRSRARTALGILAATIAAGGALAAQACAHAQVFPTVVEADSINAYSLVVPNESNSAIETVELSLPDGFAITSFEVAPGWAREAKTTGSAGETVTTEVTWTSGGAPRSEAAWFRFTARPVGGRDTGDPYVFSVTMTYADGKTVEWDGAEDSSNPAPVVRVVDSLGAGAASGGPGDADAGATDTTGMIALILALLALGLAIAGLVRRGGRSLT